MSDEAAFLRAVAQNPTDATAKLVYADWLDEHGEPDRAAYLRLIATEAPDPDRKRELEARVGDIWGGLLNGPPTRWDEATLYALGGLERVLETYRLFNERTSDLDLDFCIRLVPNSDTIGELWRPIWLPAGDTFTVEPIGDWEATLTTILSEWLFFERPLPSSSPGLKIETAVGRADAVSAVIESVRDVIRPRCGWRINFQPTRFYLLAWVDFALESADRVLFFHFGVTD